MDIESGIEELRKALNQFDSNYADQRKMLMDMTVTRFRRDIEAYNKSQNFIKVRSIDCNCSCLEVNRSTYYMMQLLYKDFQKRHVQNMVSMFEVFGEEGERIAHEEMLRCIEDSFDNLDSMEKARQVANQNGICYIDLDCNLMWQWVNAHTLGYMRIFMIMYLMEAFDTAHLKLIYKFIHELATEKYRTNMNCRLKFT